MALLSMHLDLYVHDIGPTGGYTSHLAEKSKDRGQDDRQKEREKLEFSQGYTQRQGGQGDYFIWKVKGILIGECDSEPGEKKKAMKRKLHCCG